MNNHARRWLWISALIATPFLGGADECSGPPTDPEPVYCQSDAECGASQRCNTDECLSPCGEGEDCPAVCSGICEPAPEPVYCFEDAECGASQRCNTDECLSPCGEG